MLLCPDTGPLLVLARIGRLDLLGPDIALVDSVLHECTVRSDDAAHAILRLADVHGTVAALHQTTFPARLGPGESAVLSWARAHGTDVVCVFDDRAARTAARSLSLRVTGTLGLLMKAKIDGQLDMLRPWLAQALGAGLYLDKPTVERALSAVGE
ncbi:MAG TPA: hypothetical protein VLC09_04390 [Polyangiaceae bacterium]|nr:hypothetical protein [Polyangiaceae bacterium]